MVQTGTNETPGTKEAHKEESGSHPTKFLFYPLNFGEKNVPFPLSAPDEKIEFPGL